MEITHEKIRITASDWEQWLGNWIWRATQCLVEAPSFNPSPKWISKRLDISLSEAVDALEGLERLGCISRDGASFKVITNWHQLTEKDLESVRMLRAQALITHALLTKLEHNDKYTSQFFRADTDIIKKYVPKFIELYKQINDEGIKKGCNEIYGSQITFSKLTADETNGGLQ